MKILQTYVRIYVAELDPAVVFYESVTGQPTICDSQLACPQGAI